MSFNPLPKTRVNAQCNGGKKLNPFNNANLWGSRRKRIAMPWVLLLSLSFPSTSCLCSPFAFFFFNYLQGMATIAQRFCLFNVLLPPRTETVTLPIASLSSFLSLSRAVCLLLLSKPLGTPVSVVTRGGVSAPHVMLTGANVSWYSPTSLGQAALRLTSSTGRACGHRLGCPHPHLLAVRLASVSPCEMRVGLLHSGSSQVVWFVIIK